jgi:hypothetical protein
VFDELEGRSRHEFASTFWMAIAAESGGLADKARELALRSLVERDPLVVWSRVFPFWDGIRTHDYYREIARTIWGDAG